MNIKKHIPNSLTLLNLLCGVLAIFSLFAGNVQAIPILVAFSLLADFLDGLVARALHVSSPIGKELDSLADMVSFGVLPGIIMVYLVSQSYPETQGKDDFIQAIFQTNSLKSKIILFFPLIITLFSALRLAKFNISTDQDTEFKGLATPASTILIIGALFVHMDNNELLNFLNNYVLLNILSLILALLLVSNIPMFSFKLKNFGLKENKWQIIFLACSFILIAVFKLNALALIIVLYVLLNMIRKLL